MSKIAYVFSGQGAQYAGMGHSLYETFPVVSQTFDTAKAILGYNLLTLTEEQLTQTQYAQPAIFTLSVALYRLLKEVGIQPDIVAGLSLGEYAALVAAETIRFEEMLPIVKERARVMQESSQLHPSTMLAVFTENVSFIEEQCALITQNVGYVVATNYNTIGQIIVSGEEKAVQVFEEKLKEQGIKSKRLAVSGAFHTKLMQEAADKLAPYLHKQHFETASIPIVCNVDADYLGNRSVAEVLINQMVRPVYWQQSVEKMVLDGVDTFIELGPKKVLSTFIKKINKQVNLYNIEDTSSFQSCMNKLEGKNDEIKR